MSTKSGKEMGGVRGTLLHWWCLCKAVGQPLQKLVWKVLKRLKRELAYDWTLSSYQAEDSKPETLAHSCPTAVFTMAKQNQPRHSPGEVGQWYIHANEFYSSRKKQTTSSA